MCNKWFHWKFEYSVKYLHNLNLTPVPIFIFVFEQFFFFRATLFLNGLATKFFNFENFHAFFHALQSLSSFCTAGKSSLSLRLFARDPGGLIILTLINPPVRFSSLVSHRATGSPSLFHRPFLFPSAKDLTAELQHGH